MITHGHLKLTDYLIVFIVMVFSSCYSPRYVYSPCTQNIPQLTKKGDINIGGYLATGGGSAGPGYASSVEYNRGVDVHAGYAVSDHFAIMINKYNRWEKNSGDNNFFAGDSAVIKYKRSLTEMATGYFTSIRKDSKKSFFQVFAGIAFGRFQIDDNNINNGIQFSRFHYARVTKLFIQPAIIIGPQQNLTASFSSRFSEIFYHKISTNYTSSELDDYLLSNLSSSPVFFWEPSVNYSLTFKKLKGMRVNFQSALAILINKRFVDYRTINIALGLIVNNDLFKSKAKKNK